MLVPAGRHPTVVTNAYRPRAAPPAQSTKALAQCAAVESCHVDRSGGARLCRDDDPRRHGTAFLASCLVQAGTILTAGIALFPFLMPSSTQPGHGLTVWDA